MKREDRKIAWMKAYSKIVTEAIPQMSGKIDWNEATYLYNSRLTPEEAAQKKIELCKKGS